MDIMLTTLNSKFIHSNLAIRYLANYIKEINDVEVREFTINQNIDFITSEIFKADPDLIGFSVYIWNLEEILEICKILKMVNPNIKIMLGGPEVSFDEERVMEDYPFIDFIIFGEGEETFRELIFYIKEGNEDLSDIEGLVFREGEKVFRNNPRPLIQDLDKIPSPYENIGKEFENKIIYYESSRGCPFNCEFCLSSTLRGVRYFNIERVKKDLDNLIEGKVRQVKFVDRTFNANKSYAMEIMDFIMDKDPKNINFHFEVTAHLLDEEMLKFLNKAKEGLFQFEIGVQSTNPKTIDAINRITDFERLSKVTKQIQSYKNIHQHLDLIAGLPYEDYNIFEKSFNDVYNLKPEKIQLGFLKLLKGSGLRLNEKEYGYKYLNKPPYEVLENKYIGYTDMIRLKDIEKLVDNYYNEGYFGHTLEFIIKNNYSSPFKFYEDFADYWAKEGYYEFSHSRNKLYSILKDFSKYKEYPNIEIIKNLLKYDYMFNNKKPSLPNNLEIAEFQNKQKTIHDILKDERILNNKLQKYRDIPTKRLINMVSVEKFNRDILNIVEENYKSIEEEIEIYILFDHTNGEIIRAESYDITDIVKELI